MDTEIITKRQCVVMMITFLLGSSLVMGVGKEAGRDAWLAVITGMLFSLPVFFVYCRLLTLNPNKGLYDIIINTFGNIAGKIVVLLYAWYAFHLGAMVTRNFTEFIMIVILNSTPQYVIAIFMSLLAIWAVKAGLEVIARWTVAILPVILLAIIIVTLFFIPYLEPGNIKPVLYNGIKPVLESGFMVFTFPFAEMVLFTVIFGSIKKKSNPYRIFYRSLIIGGSTLLLITVRSLLALGEANDSIMYFSSYASVRLIRIGNFLERIEVSVAIVFMLSGFVKVCICLLAAAKGAASVLNIGNYRQIAAPIGLLMMVLTVNIYTNTKEMFDWAAKVYPFYAIPFQILIPVIIWIVSEIKSRRVKNKSLRCNIQS